VRGSHGSGIGACVAAARGLWRKVVAAAPQGCGFAGGGEMGSLLHCSCCVGIQSLQSAKADCMSTRESTCLRARAD